MGKEERDNQLLFEQMPVPKAVMTMAVPTIAKTGSCQPPEDCARLPHTFPLTATPTYEKSEMKPIDVPA